MKKKVIDIPEIEDIQEDPEQLILDHIKKHGFITTHVLVNHYKISKGIFEQRLRDLRNRGIIVSKKKLIKFKGEPKYHSTYIYVMAEDANYD